MAAAGPPVGSVVSAAGATGLGAPGFAGAALGVGAGCAGAGGAAAGVAAAVLCVAGLALGAGGAGLGAAALSVLDPLEPPDPLDGELDGAAGLGALAEPPLGSEPEPLDEWATCGVGRCSTRVLVGHGC